MPATAQVYGVAIEDMKADALLQPVGSQKNHMSSAFAAAFPSPELVVVSGGTAYQADFVAGMSGSSSGVTMPDLAAPTTNLENALADPSATIIIRSKTFPSRRIVAPVAAASADGSKLVISPTLDGVATLRSVLAAMLLPAGLDVSSGGSFSAQTLVDDMGYNDADPAAALSLGAGWGSRRFGGYVSNESGGAYRLSPWYEICPVNVSNTAAPNSAVEFRNLRAYVKRNGVWVRLLLCDARGDYWEAAWYHKDGYDINGYTTRTKTADASITGGFRFNMSEFRNSPHWVNHGYGNGDIGLFSFDLNPSSNEPICIMAECRKTLINPSGTDDRNNVPLLCHVAADWWGDSRVGASHQGRFRYVTNDWETFTATTITTDKSAVGGQTYPGNLTASQLLADPPPLTL